MEGKLYVEVVTPEKIIFRGNVTLISVPGEGGSFSLLGDHAPIVASLKQGFIKLEGKFMDDFIYPCNSGVIECLKNQVTILVES
jgi:F-type H+-transporting ATPase subunit epsilon